MDIDKLKTATTALAHLSRTRAGEVRPTTHPKGAVLHLLALEVQCPDEASAQATLAAIQAAQDAALEPLRALHRTAAQEALADTPAAPAAPAAAS